MTKSSISIFLFILFITSSCGEYFYYTEKKDFNRKYTLKAPKAYCSTNQQSNKLTIAGSSKKAVRIFNDLVTSVPEIKRLSLIELSVMWGLFQLNVRPDLASPTSRLQAMVKIKNKLNYLQFDQHVSKTPYLSGLNYILKRYNSKASLIRIAKLLHKHLPRTIPIDNDFSQFLEKNQTKLQNHDQFKSAFFKASQVIRKGESLPKINFKKITLQRDRKKPVRPNTHLFATKISKDQNIYCNVDLTLYKNNIFLISNEDAPEGLPFSISKKNGDHIILVASNQLQTIMPFKETFNLKGKANGNPMVFCYLKSKQTQNEFSIVSSKGRDPGQFIYHLLNIDLQDSKTLKETQNYINFPRHLFLRSPDRLIYESIKGSEEQLQNYLGLNFPIFHKTHLGRIWIHAKLNDSKKSGLLLDRRTEGALACIR
ncbi:MAG: hypothetical protein HN576_12055 [Bacteriovoracaceae bacterium]|jgi:hypothetical protein|nr:hypothetical protein [Bacteriovoracaceae bacterium]